MEQNIIEMDPYFGPGSTFYMKMGKLKSFDYDEQKFEFENLCPRFDENGHRVGSDVVNETVVYHPFLEIADGTLKDYNRYLGLHFTYSCNEYGLLTELPKTLQKNWLRWRNFIHGCSCGVNKELLHRKYNHSD